MRYRSEDWFRLFDDVATVEMRPIRLTVLGIVPPVKLPAPNATALDVQPLSRVTVGYARGPRRKRESLEALPRDWLDHEQLRDRRQR